MIPDSPQDTIRANEYNGDGQKKLAEIFGQYMTAKLGVPVTPNVLARNNPLTFNCAVPDSTGVSMVGWCPSKNWGYISESPKLRCDKIDLIRQHVNGGLSEEAFVVLGYRRNPSKSWVKDSPFLRVYLFDMRLPLNELCHVEDNLPIVHRKRGNDYMHPSYLFNKEAGEVIYNMDGLQV